MTKMAKKPKIERVYINGKTFAKASLADLVSMTAADIGKLTRDQSVRLEKRLYKEVKKRLDVIYKHGFRSIIAEYNFGDMYPQKPTEKPTIYATKHRVTALHDFLNNDKSSYTGLKKFYAKEEMRVFGKKGAGFKNEDQRTRFWRAYEEFMHQNPVYIDQSTRVQQFLGRESFWRHRDFSMADFNELLTKLQTADMGVDIRADAGIDFDI